MEKRRELWIDAAKGLSIIFVVMGHSGDGLATHYLFWFHVPLFFLLSGMVFKPTDPKLYLSWAWKRTRGLMIPYFAYGLLITMILLIFTFDLKSFAGNIVRLLYGGLSLTGPFGVLWFITCLLFTQLIFGFIVRFRMRMQLLLIASCYLLAHLISLTSLSRFNLPWNIDVALLAITYYALGYYGKRLIPLLIGRIAALPLLITLCAGILFMDYTGVLSYSLNMKYKEYDALLLDLVIPMLFSLMICAISFWLSKRLPLKGLGYLGRNTIAIMYLHLPVNYALKYLIGMEYGLIVFTIIGVGIPVLITLMASYSPILSKLFLGHSGSRRPVISRGRGTAAPR